MQEIQTHRRTGFGMAAPLFGGSTRLKQLLFMALGGLLIPPKTWVKPWERQKVLSLPCFCSMKFFLILKHLY